MALRSVRKSLKFDDEFIVNTKFIGIVLNIHNVIQVIPK